MLSKSLTNFQWHCSQQSLISLETKGMLRLRVQHLPQKISAQNSHCACFFSSSPHSGHISGGCLRRSAMSCPEAYCEYMAA